MSDLKAFITFAYFREYYRIFNIHNRWAVFGRRDETQSDRSNSALYPSGVDK